MIVHYLQSALKDINDLIKLTKEDIENIKKADHDKLIESMKLKEELLVIFESKKSLIDNELVKLTKNKQGKELEELLSDEQKELLSTLQNGLTDLKKVNKEYAKYVVSVSEFYNSLFDKLFPLEIDGYTKSIPKPASFFKIEA